MIVLAARLRTKLFRPGILLTGLLGRLDTDFLGVGFSAPGAPDWYIL
jgi:hypothetical protein